MVAGKESKLFLSRFQNKMGRSVDGETNYLKWMADVCSFIELNYGFIIFL